MSLRYDAIFIRAFGAPQYLSTEPVFDYDEKTKVIGILNFL